MPYRERKYLWYDCKPNGGTGYKIGHGHVGGVVGQPAQDGHSLVEHLLGAAAFRLLLDPLLYGRGDY